MQWDKACETRCSSAWVRRLAACVGRHEHVCLPCHHTIACRGVQLQAVPAHSSGTLCSALLFCGTSKLTNTPVGLRCHCRWRQRRLRVHHGWLCCSKDVGRVCPRVCVWRAGHVSAEQKHACWAEHYHHVASEPGQCTFCCQSARCHLPAPLTRPALHAQRLLRSSLCRPAQTLTQGTCSPLPVGSSWPPPSMLC